MSKYLYGASVQGIQSFIFKTNKLAEIIGASELIEQLCTSLFEKSVTDFKKENLIMGAAGNVKYVFDNMDDCKKVVRNFPKSAMEHAPGVTVSQAVVNLEKNDLPSAIDLLEKKLKTQRNISQRPIEMGFMGVERSRRTGGVAYTQRNDRNNKKEVICESTAKKRSAIASQKEKGEDQSKENLFKKISGLDVKNREIAFDISDITKSGKNSWIAVIHADGNGLGSIIQNVGGLLMKESKFSAFSNAIETATKNAVQQAFRDVISSDVISKEHKPDYRYPIRPVVLGGDDLTVIIRADLALEFTKVFLRAFEITSREEFEALGLAGYEKGITACAGIAYVKESYPLHYALNLAEDLCGDAKKKVKASDCENKYGNIPKSSVAFYKVQDSFVADLKELKERTLKTSSGLDFYAGPYLMNELDQLNNKLDIIAKEANASDKSKAVGKLRQIVSEYYKDDATAFFMLERMKEINSDFYKELQLENEKNNAKKNNKSQLLDLITLHSFNYGNREN
ncbi:hypothetical protein K8354_13200 [Polaribacter litorisediminis]|uniref:Cas10/Cmr2 second palm domain-containing protein n=1 Tax=Polaribacter litorisediminis TaxID=1908341 RepID=UPI001CC10F8D|nr:hypothetical protein [Polaribacter litorisediminis]UAM97270.1 hypothetical protein K8354_13200 [Polaribacter litorisediminis]